VVVAMSMFMAQAAEELKAYRFSVQEEKEKLTFDLYFGFWKF